MKKAYRLLLTTANIIFYFVIIGLWITVPDETTLNMIVTGANIAFTGIIILLFRQYFSHLYKSHFFKEFSSTIVSAILILFIIGLVNYLFYINPAQLDLTKQKWNSLTVESEQILAKVEGSLIVHIFGKKKQEKPIRSFLERYRLVKNDLEILFHDTQLRPDMVSKYQIKKDGVIVLTFKGRKEYVETINELAMAKALARISRNQDPVIYYFSGLNGMNLNESHAQGGLVLKRALVDSSYALKEVDVQTLGEIPTDVQSVIIWGPKIDLTSKQISLLERYLNQGGALITAIDPNFNEDKLGNYRSFLKSRGIEIRNNLIIDNHSYVNGSDGVVPLIQKSSSDHDISSQLTYPIFLPLASSVRSVAKTEENDLTFTALLNSTVFPHSWAENSPRDYAHKKHQYDNEVDYPGPVAMAGAVENKKNNWRIVAFGSSTFIQNNYANFTNNFKLFTRSLSWLVEKNNQLVLNLPVFKEKPVFISKPHLGAIFYFSVIFVPLLLVATAIFSYRRKLKVS